MSDNILNLDKDAEDSATWSRKWTKDRYVAKHQASWKIADAYLNQPIGRLLDIGCGFAWESRWFNEKYGTELWLLDGDSSTNAAKSTTASYGNWNTDSSQLKFYHTFDFLNSKLQELGTKNYHLIDANNINIPSDIKFDVITAQNVFAHGPEPLKFLENAKHAMHDNTLLFIQTSQAFRIRNNEFDTIYHEHMSFFNVKSMNELCKRAGLHLLER
jgi:SAM-dependent methyltransferase